MSSLDDIAVSNEQTQDPVLSPQVLAILNEISALVQQLLNHNISESIDLRSLPLMPGDYETLRAVVGEGEVSAVVDAMGPSEVIETLIPGVWWVIHRNTDDEVMSELIEITRIPSILETSREDLSQAQEILTNRVERLADDAQRD